MEMDMQTPESSRTELAVALVATGIFLMTTLQTYALWKTGAQLANVKVSQDQPVDQSTKIRAQLDALAGKTAALAQKGNANAQAIIDDLKKQGITVKPTP